MADIAEADPSYNKILLDREKFFKNDYESLPIPNIDMSYFDSQNTIDLMGSFLLHSNINNYL